MRTLTRQIRYTVDHVLCFPVAVQGGWYSHGFHIPGPYRLFFYSFDCHEPPHVYVHRERMVCTFGLTPVALSAHHGFSPRELNRIRAIILESLEHILEAWHDHCGA